jgi:hypothetical protein
MKYICNNCNTEFSIILYEGCCDRGFRDYEFVLCPICYEDVMIEDNE